MANRYTRALKQIKDSTLEEKLKLLEEIPTNNTTGLYTDVPGVETPQTVTPGDLNSPLNLEQDGDGSENYTGNDTSGLFEGTTIRTVEPPGDTTAILGPMISMWYAWANYTQIGYVRESDRKMVNLGRITGEMSNWNEVSGFVSYGQLTLEQAVWYKNQSRQDYRAFYPGPPSNEPDQYGRYIGSIINTSKSTTEIERKSFTPGTNRTYNASDNYSLQQAQLIAGYGLRPDGTMGPSKLGDTNRGHDGKIYKLVPRPGYGYNMWIPVKQAASDFANAIYASHEPSGKVLTESQKKKILRNVKKPVQVKEIPTKVKVKPTSRKNKSVGVDMMKVPDTPKQYKPQTNIWSKGDYQANVRASQEKKNEVLELLGAAEHHWTYLTEEKRRKKQEKVNEMMSAEYDKQMEDMYEKYKSKQNKLDKTVSALKQKKKYLSDSDTSVEKKKTFTKWYDSVDSTTADKIISDAKIETKDQIMELVVAEFNRLRLQEGMSSKGFEYIYGLAVNNIVSQYRIDSKFASDLLHSSADATDYEFGPGYPGSHINSIGDYQVDSSRLVNVNAYYDSTFGSVSGSGGSFTLNTIDGPGAASRSSLQSALGITLPTGIPNDPLTGTPTEGSAVQRTFTGAKPGNIINFTWGFSSSEKGLPAAIKVDDYAFVAISGRTTKFVSILGNGDVKGGSFKYRLNAGDIGEDGNVRVSIGVVDVHDKIYNTTLRVSSFGSLYAGDLGSVGDTTDAADLGMPVKPPKKGDEIALDTIPYEPPSPGPGGYKPPGSYDPNKFYNLDNKTPMPSPNLPQTGPGQSSIPDGTEVAASYPTTNTPLDKVGGFKGIPKGKGIYPMDKDGNLYNPQTGLPIKKAGKKQTTMVAHHEPQGEVLSEKKKLKSVKDFSNYPGKPSPMGWPEEEPPKTINGYHPDLVDGKEVSNRYNRLDAVSAKAMPPTGNPYIDKKVKAAAARIKEEAKKPKDVAPKDAPPSPALPTVLPNGYHAQYGKHYKHDKLDPQSAEFMPPTGDPEIDANIKKATNAKEKARKLKILKGKG